MRRRGASVAAGSMINPALYLMLCRAVTGDQLHHRDGHRGEEQGVDEAALAENDFGNKPDGEKNERN